MPGVSENRLSAAALVLVSSLGAALNCQSAPVSVPAPAPSSDSHQRMRTELREIYNGVDEDNHWLGDGAAEKSRRALRGALRIGASREMVWGLHLETGEHEMRMGNDTASLEHFEAAYAILPELTGQVSKKAELDSIFRLGIAYLRYGETQNCATRHNADSCILPIRGAGIHEDPRGSRGAIQFFTEFLEKVPNTSPQYLKATWLLNIAYMTLGTHPQEVPEEYLLPLQAFVPQSDFRRFRNVAPSLGIDSFNLSGGAVFDDLNGDGSPDLFATTFDPRGEPHLFINRGDGTFEDRTEAAGLKELYGGLNVVHADYDNDGDLDLYVLRGAWLSYQGRSPNSLLRNDSSAEGGIRFVDVTFDAGLGDVHYPTQTAAWADYDNDGDVDLFVGNEWDETIDAPCQLFRNNGDGTFTDVAEQAGVADPAYIKAVVWGDVDEDRFPDLFVSFLGGPNRLYRNNRDGTFTDIASTAGVEGPRRSFPSWFWDYDNDGHLDLYVASYQGGIDSVAMVAASYLGIEGPWETGKLFRGDGKGSFVDVSQQTGLTRLHLAMGSNFGDLDNDGFLDFYLGTGYPDYEAVMPNVLYRNRGGRSFEDITLAAGFGHLQKGHAIAFVDFDADGDLDVFEQMGGAFPGDRFGDALFVNPGFENHWVAVKLVGTKSNRAAIGARIVAEFDDAGNSRTVHRHVSSGGSFGGNPFRQTLGLGAATQIRRLGIYWPTSDTTQTFTDVAVDRVYQIVEGLNDLQPLR